MAGLPVLIVNPGDDEEFAAHADRLVTSGAASAEQLEERLHAWYPRAIVHPRILAGESVTMWYVYRDGRWIPREPRGVRGGAHDGERPGRPQGDDR